MEKEPLLTQVWEISTTVASDEVAKKIAAGLLDSRRAACIQITGPIRSFYRWNNEVHEDLEWKLTIKTSQAGLDACWSEIRRLHPYEVPELIAHCVPKVSAEYEQWLLEQVTVATSHASDGIMKMQPEVEPQALAAFVDIDNSTTRLAPSAQISSDYSPTWHLRVAGLPANASTSATALILEHSVETLELPTGPSPLVESFEQVAERLSRLPNLHFEPDGSFSWCSIQRPSTNQRVWRLDGMVYDRENHVEYVELKGNCDLVSWETLTRILSGVEYVPLIVQLVGQGIWISEQEFKRCLS